MNAPALNGAVRNLGAPPRTRRPPPWRRNLKTTREGKIVIFITLGLGFAAINTGNNLLYLVLGLLLSLITLSGVLSEQVIRDVTVRRVYPGAIHAGRECFLAVELENQKRRIASISLEVEEVFEDPTVVQAARPGYALVLRPGEKKLVVLRTIFARRGVHQTRGLHLATQFPFSFFRKWRLEPLEDVIVVLPAIRPVRSEGLWSPAEGFQVSSAREGRGEDYHGLREHQPGDDPRDIHWKTSARQRRLVTRVYEEPVMRRVVLLVPNVATSEGVLPIAPPGTDKKRLKKKRGQPQPRVHPEVEGAIAEAASLAVAYIAAGWAVGVETYDGRVEAEGGPGHLVRLLEHLARVPVHPADSETRLLVAHAAGQETVLVRHPDQRHVAVGSTTRIHEVPQAP